jgi:hypothetical protein
VFFLLTRPLMGDPIFLQKSCIFLLDFKECIF